MQFSRIRLFIIKFASTEQAVIDFRVDKFVVFHHFYETFPCIAFLFTSPVQYFVQQFSDLLFVITYHSAVKADTIVSVMSYKLDIQHIHKFSKLLLLVVIQPYFDFFDFLTEFFYCWSWALSMGYLWLFCHSKM